MVVGTGTGPRHSSSDPTLFPESQKSDLLHVSRNTRIRVLVLVLVPKREEVRFPLNPHDSPSDYSTNDRSVDGPVVRTTVGTGSSSLCNLSLPSRLYATPVPCPRKGVEPSRPTNLKGAQFSYDSFHDPDPTERHGGRRGASIGGRPTPRGSLFSNTPPDVHRSRPRTPPSRVCGEGEGWGRYLP